MYFKSYGWRKIPAKPKKCHFEASKVATSEMPKQCPHWEKFLIAPDDALRSSNTNTYWVILKPLKLPEVFKKAYFAP